MARRGTAFKRASFAFVGALAVLAVCLVGTGTGRVSAFPSLPQSLLLLGALRVHGWRTRGGGRKPDNFVLTSTSFAPVQLELSGQESASDSWGLVGDAFVDSNTIDQDNLKPQGSRVRRIRTAFAISSHSSTHSILLKPMQTIIIVVVSSSSSSSSSSGYPFLLPHPPHPPHPPHHDHFFSPKLAMGDSCTHSHTSPSFPPCCDHCRPAAQYAKKELSSYNDVWSAKGAAHNKAAAKASQELDSYADVFDSTPSKRARAGQVAAAPATHMSQHGKGSNEELSSYSGILSFTPSEEVTGEDTSEQRHRGKSQTQKKDGELSSYNNILSFSTGRSASRGRHQKRANVGKGFEDEWNSLWTTATTTKAEEPSSRDDARSKSTASARGHASTSKEEQKKKVEKELREVDKAIASETRAHAAAQEADVPHTKRGVKVRNSRFFAYAPHTKRGVKVRNFGCCAHTHTHTHTHTYTHTCACMYVGM
jgi:hypothetical protein